MGANFEMDPRWIFFTVGQFLTVSREITYARFAMAEIEREGETEEITSSGKNLCGKS